MSMNSGSMVFLLVSAAALAYRALLLHCNVDDHIDHRSSLINALRARPGEPKQARAQNDFHSRT